MESGKLQLYKATGILGILSAAIFFISIGVAVFYSPWFSWTENRISELAGGVGETPIWAAQGMTSLIYNIGLVFAGILGILYALALKKCHLFTTHLGQIAIFLLLIDMSALSGIGLFPVTLGKIHTVVSVGFFVLIPSVLLIMGYEIRRLFGKNWWFFINILSGIAMCAVFMFLFMPHLSAFSKGIAEMTIISSIYLVCIAVNIKLLLQPGLLYQRGILHLKH